MTLILLILIYVIPKSVLKEHYEYWFAKSRAQVGFMVITCAILDFITILIMLI